MDSGYSDEFNVSPQDVLGQAHAEGGYSERAMAAKRAGYNPLIEAAPLFERRSQGGGGGGGMMGGQPKQAESKEPSMFARDADFYANAVEDLGAAQVLASSKDGRAVFQMYDPFELEIGADEKNPKGPSRMTTWRVIPKGSRKVPTPDGVQDLPVHAYARQYGVSTVPFKGGAEQAEAFRGLMSETQLLMSNLAKLEQLYSHETFLTPFGYSKESSEARGLEANIQQSFMRVMTGARGLGGNTSDRDMSFASSMTPQRASSWVTRFKGNEMALLKQVRAMAQQKVKSAAHANGLDFLEESSDGSRPSEEQIYEDNSITLK